jgi:uncharacterized protein YaiI (UPF0178 family)
VKGPLSPRIFVDADGCPVKEEVYRVARRYQLEVTLVSNAWMRIPREARLTQVVVPGGLDVADDWIVEHVHENDIVISDDIPLASRSLKKGALVLSPRGRVHSEDSIGDALASRDLMSQLRDLGTMTGGPAPFDKRDRSRFLERLDATIQSVRRKGA